MLCAVGVIFRGVFVVLLAVLRRRWYGRFGRRGGRTIPAKAEVIVLGVDNHGRWSGYPRSWWVCRSAGRSVPRSPGHRGWVGPLLAYAESVSFAAGLLSGGLS